MRRRKQAKPFRLLDDHSPVTSSNMSPDIPQNVFDNNIDENGEHNGTFRESNNEDFSKELMCPRCQEQFTDFSEFLTHKIKCENKARKYHESEHSDLEDMVVSEEDDFNDDIAEDETRDHEDEIDGKRIDRVRRYQQDAANNNDNNSYHKEQPLNEDQDNLECNKFGIPYALTNAVAAAAAGHVTLETLENTKVAVAQFAATTNAINNEPALQELALLQSTLFSLRHQQVFQLQLISQLEQRLSVNRSKDKSSCPTPSQVAENLSDNSSVLVPNESTLLSSRVENRTPTPKVTEKKPLSTEDNTFASDKQNTCRPTDNNLLSNNACSSLITNYQQPLCSIPSSLASTIITNNDPPPSLNEPNCLEMLQKRAQEVLDDASQGVLANNLADELAFRKSKDSMSQYDSKSGRNEPFFKHRCRYCGKVFGSDSALQIHIRSHTGERPFKCNVCGSRFTTKGNLKVHFQRHAMKFPHIKMNPNQVPEYLDEYHPPLLAQLGQQQSPRSSPNPPNPPNLISNSFPSNSSNNFPMLFRSNSIPLALPSHHFGTNDQTMRLFPHHPLFLKREEPEMPENLSMPSNKSVSPPQLLPAPQPQQLLIDADKGNSEIEGHNLIKTECKGESENEPDAERSSNYQYDGCSNDSNVDPLDNNSEEMHQDEPENLSKNSENSKVAENEITQTNSRSMNALSPTSSNSSGSIGQYTFNATRDPHIYANLLPRPGSNDNSWESLIEVTKTSETTKLQQLVDNIEHKLTDPNQCIICHRVLSCKSALQMHYRTHTGERPFRCKICRRAFTTKGNLKTHMGVHRTKPPMRVLHQCPVCHKKFTNALVLQQHIRLHTGEPTDLTPDQIQAAEIKDCSIPGQMSSINPLISYPNFSLPNFSISQMKYEADDDYDDNEGDGDGDGDGEVDGSDIDCENDKNSVISGSVENQVQSKSESIVENGDTSPLNVDVQSPMNLEMQSPINHIKSERKLSTSQTSCTSPSLSDFNSIVNGAIDLTPRSSNSHTPLLSPGPSQGALFPNFGVLPPIASPLITSALTSLNQSVLSSTTFNPLNLVAVGAVNNKMRGNTTCNICYKTFACHSALEIHYRSHTKERPFKCGFCERGFSTKGNMKQHMLTHKSRDMTQKVNYDVLARHANSDSSDSEAKLPNMTSSLTMNEIEMRHSVPISHSTQAMEAAIVNSLSHSDKEMLNRPSSPVLQFNSRYCSLCQRNFSSSSALQIHMRTHTGDKPFQCHICSKAFTTKGNLKVHMEIHTVTGTTKRGRRMYLSLQMPMVQNVCDFQHLRQEHFYPYPPVSYVNSAIKQTNK